MDRPVIAFDIETVPDPEIGRRVFNLPGDLHAVASAMQERRREETAGRTDFPKPPYHRIVAIAVAWCDPQRDQFKLASLAPDSRDEGELIEAFLQVLGKEPRLVSWNGNGFDLPVIRYRALLHGLDAGAYYQAGDKWNNYVDRYKDLHTDLMDVLSGYGASDRMGLDDMCRVAGLPGKTVTEGHRVFQHIARAEWALVQAYCELDALNTLVLFLLWEVSRGGLERGQFAATLQRIAATLAADPRPEVAACAPTLAALRPGSTRRALDSDG